MRTTGNLKMTGILYGVSLGPGDPGLITRKAWALLHSGADWSYPVRKKQGKSYALNIAIEAGLLPPENSMQLVFPMTHDRDILVKYWLQAAQTVVAKLQAGRDVVFLVEGDASSYSTFQHLAKTVAALDAKLQIETIAGVSSFNAAAACAKMPLADTDDTVAIIPAGYGIKMIENMLKDFDTLVLLKIKPLLDDILDLLEHKNLLNKVNYLSLLMVHNSHRMRGELIRGCRKK